MNRQKILEQIAELEEQLDEIDRDEENEEYYEMVEKEMNKAANAVRIAFEEFEKQGFDKEFIERLFEASLVGGNK